MTIRTAGSVPAPAQLVEAFGRDELVPDTTVSPELLLALNDPRAQAAAIPGGGGIARAVDVALIYQSLVNNPGTSHPADWLADATTHHPQRQHQSQRRRAGQPHHRRHRLWRRRNERLPVVPACRRAVRSPGAGGQLCWVDVDSGMSFCFLHDTLQLDPSHDLRRCRELNALAIACVAS